MGWKVAGTLRIGHTGTRRPELHTTSSQAPTGPSERAHRPVTLPSTRQPQHPGATATLYTQGLCLYHELSLPLRPPSLSSNQCGIPFLLFQ